MNGKEGIELLLDCLNTGTDSGRAVHLENLSIDQWEVILQQSNRHGIAPLGGQKSGTGTTPSGRLYRLPKGR